jgi:hypothetical protein
MNADDGDDDDDDGDDDWFGGFAALNVDSDNTNEATVPAPPAFLSTATNYASLHDILLRFHRRDDALTLEQDYQLKTRLVESHMGSMAQCRGHRGKELLEAGAVEALIATLAEILHELSSAANDSDSDKSPFVLMLQVMIQLAIVSWGAIRDLGCGNADIRARTRTLGGMKLLADYLKRYHGTPWEAIGSIHLKLITSITGALRNVTHSARENCVELHHHGVSDLLIARLLGATTLPDPSRPFREACFRSASTLINMAEKSEECARIYASNLMLIHLMVDATGALTKKGVLLHLGLVAILVAAKEMIPEQDYEPDWLAILERERARKLGAQQREEERKRQKIKAAAAANGS